MPPYSHNDDTICMIQETFTYSRVSVTCISSRHFSPKSEVRLTIQTPTSFRRLHAFSLDTPTAYENRWMGWLSGSSPYGGYSSRHNASSSHYRRRPRDGYIQRMMHRLKRMLRDLYNYARQHPVKVLMMILPLITGGALLNVLGKFGIHLPAHMFGDPGGHGGRSGYGSYSSAGGDGGGAMQSMMKIAQAFM